jgi:nucleoside-diphosphate-sugar epimerase
LTNSSSKIEYVPRRSWDNSITRQADIGRAKELLSLNPETRLEQGLEATIGWFRENYEKIERSCEF